MAGRPLGLLAELTYRCPLHCPYCSNPVELRAYREELDADQWRDVLSQARELGVLQVHFSGGEPLARRDLVSLVAHAHELGMYTSLVTSGLALRERKASELAHAGLDHVQLSVQDSTADRSDALAGTPSFHAKLGAAEAVRGVGLPLTVNAVLHRRNAERAGEIADLAARMKAVRLELAHTQFYGWALRNRAALLPSREQIADADAQVEAARARWGERMEIIYVLPDYFEGQPKPCMYGWGSRQLTVAPNGDVLPCPAAGVIPDLGIVNVIDEALEHIWFHSIAFERFRGTAWMDEPCRSCPRQEIDYGGCRCQAYLLTGDAAATDPACRLSPDHHLVADATHTANAVHDTGHAQHRDDLPSLVLRPSR